MAQDQPSNWITESLRLTVFPDPSKLDLDASWWQELVGDTPEVRTVQKIGPVVHEYGAIRGGYCNLSMDYQPGRVDWLMTPIVPIGPPLDRFPNFGRWEDAIEVYRELLAQWLRTAPAFTRIAFGGVLLLPVSGKREGYERLRQYMHAVQIDPAGSSDFSYSINRPRHSRVISEVRINRLSRWSVARLSSIQLHVSGAGVPAKVLESADGVSACRAELDINSAASYDQVIPEGARLNIVDELIELAGEIARKGDIP